jgi:hypothetical protein
MKAWITLAFFVIAGVVVIAQGGAGTERPDRSDRLPELERRVDTLTTRLNDLENAAIRGGKAPRYTSTEAVKIHSIPERGGYVLLQDGSAWAIESESKKIAYQWDIGQRVKAQYDGAGDYPYVLFNFDESNPPEAARARYLAP